MPELPEMETYKKLLNEKVAGQRITEIQINREKSVNVNPDVFQAAVLQQKIVSIDRRAKQLLFYLENGYVLLLHLMLGGWMYFGKEEDKPKRTIQVRLSFGQHHLYFIGLRLGYLHLHSQKEVEQVLSKLGPEPLAPEFTLPAFLHLLKEKHGRIKAKLIDQDFISGIGNCYSDEICYHAGILPARKMEKLADLECSQLFRSIKQVLLDAIQHGGYMENPFFKGDALTGGYDQLCWVYDREGENCNKCGAVIVKEMISSRKTFYCPNCQR